MANVVDNAISRIQDIALACSLSSTDRSIKSAPDYPIENAEPFPFSVAYLGGGEAMFTNATIHHNFPAIHVEFHFSRVRLEDTYKDINAVAIDFPARLAKDPTLDGNVTTVLASQDAPITYTVRPMDWGKIQSQMMLFVIPFKTLQAPVSTA